MPGMVIGYRLELLEKGQCPELENALYNYPKMLM